MYAIHAFQYKMHVFTSICIMYKETCAIKSEYSQARYANTCTFSALRQRNTGIADFNPKKYTDIYMYDIALIYTQININSHIMMG